jgi:hypothetical protein
VVSVERTKSVEPAPTPEPESPHEGQAVKDRKARDQAAKEIATRLGETELGALQQIMKVVDFLGREKAQQLLQETMTIEANGGMPTLDGTRRRSPGGVFLWLAKANPQLRQYMLGYNRRERKEHARASQPGGGAGTTNSQPPRFTWDDRESVIHQLLQGQKGSTTKHQHCQRGFQSQRRPRPTMLFTYRPSNGIIRSRSRSRTLKTC